MDPTSPFSHCHLYNISFKWTRPRFRKETRIRRDVKQVIPDWPVTVMLKRVKSWSLPIVTEPCCFYGLTTTLKLTCLCAPVGLDHDITCFPFTHGPDASDEQEECCWITAVIREPIALVFPRLSPFYP